MFFKIIKSLIWSLIWKVSWINQPVLRLGRFNILAVKQPSASVKPVINQGLRVKFKDFCTSQAVVVT